MTLPLKALQIEMKHFYIGLCLWLCYLAITLSSIKAFARNSEKHPGLQRTQPARKYIFGIGNRNRVFFIIVIV